MIHGLLTIEYERPIFGSLLELLSLVKITQLTHNQEVHLDFIFYLAVNKSVRVKK